MTDSDFDVEGALGNRSKVVKSRDRVDDIDDWRDAKPLNMTQSHDVTKWTKTLKGAGSINPVWSMIAKEIAGHEGPSTLLDVGCYAGYFSNVLNGLPVQYTGMDRCEEAIVAARKISPDLDLRVGDLFDPSKEAWDFVVASRVLMHVAPLDLAIKRLCERAKRKVWCITIILKDGDPGIGCFKHTLKDGSWVPVRKTSEQELKLCVPKGFTCDVKLHGTHSIFSLERK